MRPTVLLFDVDGTLVTTGGAGRRAIERAFAELYGRPEAVSFDFSGMTDRAIVRAGFAGLGRPCEEADIDRTLAAYLSVLAEEVVRSKVYRLHDGMAEALETAARKPGFALGLGTGNVREGARLKLERVGVASRFPFGGFGDDHEDRVELIRIGAERGAALLGKPRAECRVVVIGDTPKDVAAAKGIGAESLAVATGHFDVPSLQASGATWAFTSLAQAGAVEALLG